MNSGILQRENIKTLYFLDSLKQFVIVMSEVFFICSNMTTGHHLLN